MFQTRAAACFLILYSSLALGSTAGAQSIFTGPPHAESETSPTLPPFMPQTPVLTAPPPVKIDVPLLPQPQLPSPHIPVLPTDLIQPVENLNSGAKAENNSAAAGLKAMTESDLPSEAKANNPDGIVVKYKPGSDFERPSSCAVKLNSGRLLISVKRPSKLALLETKLASAWLSADSDIELSYEDGVLRFINLSGLNEKVMIRLSDHGMPPALAAKVFALLPGHELVLSTEKLHRSELRPHDGYARRFFKTFENGQLAISQISVESVLKESDLVASLQQTDSGVKERRIIADLSKMAAVLNYVNGTNSYSAEQKAELNVNSQLNKRRLGQETKGKDKLN